MISNKEISIIIKVINGYCSNNKGMITSALAEKGQDEQQHRKS